MMGESSLLAAGSEGTVDTVTVPIACCPERPAPKQEAPVNSLLHKDTPKQQQQGQSVMAERPDKRQKVESSRPGVAVAMEIDSCQQQARSEAALHKTIVIKHKPGTQPQHEQQQVPLEERMAARAQGRVGKLGVKVIRDTMMAQQALWTEQV